MVQREANGDDRANNADSSSMISLFRATETASQARSLTDGVMLPSYLYDDKLTSSPSPLPTTPVVLPWVGYGTYKLGKDHARSCTVEALKQGYRMVDTAFIYGGETTETQVGLAIEDAISKNILKNGREDVVIVTKHWRKYHGYNETMECLRLSLSRLKVDYIDLYLIHWYVAVALRFFSSFSTRALVSFISLTSLFPPSCSLDCASTVHRPGPAWNTMNRRNDEIGKHGPWHYATHSKEDMPRLRAETWRAMEDAMIAGKVRAIGCCNFTVKHLEQLKKTARLWPPAVNQIECHPIFPQQDILDYCAKEGIAVQAYSSLGGQDVGKKFWRSMYPLTKCQVKQKAVTTLTEAPPVVDLAQKVGKTPSQVLLRWALEKNLVLIPKTIRKERMIENANIFDFSLSNEDIAWLDDQLQQALADAARREGNDIQSMSRLAWRRDPLRDLNFD